MERCPQCKQMTAERDHYTGNLVCYSTTCDFEETSRCSGKETRVTSREETQHSFQCRVECSAVNRNALTLK